MFRFVYSTILLNHSFWNKKSLTHETAFNVNDPSFTDNPKTQSQSPFFLTSLHLLACVPDRPRDDPSMGIGRQSPSFDINVFGQHFSLKSRRYLRLLMGSRGQRGSHCFDHVVFIRPHLSILKPKILLAGLMKGVTMLEKATS